MINTTPPRRPLRADARRNRLRVIDAAKAAFAERGLSVPLEEIAMRAGVGIGTLYRRFPSRTELIAAVIDELSEEFRQLAEATLTDPDPWRGLCRYLEGGLELQVRNQALREVLSAGAEGTYAGAVDLRRHTRPLLKDLMQRGKATGVLRADLEVTDIGAIFWACTGVAEVSARVAPDHWRRHLAVVLDGLRAPGTTRIPGSPLTETQLKSVFAAHVPTSPVEHAADD
jgi:AcrR family transcriptional regulator